MRRPRLLVAALAALSALAAHSALAALVALAAFGALAAAAPFGPARFGTAPLLVLAESPATAASPPASASPCPRTLKFAGSLYLDADGTVATSEVGPQVGETEPNPAR